MDNFYQTFSKVLAVIPKYHKADGLSIITWFETYDNAFQKRKKTCTDWAISSDSAKTRHAGIEVFHDNVPVKGCRIIDWDTRYSTDNKVFNIEDPRGFSFQIYADNLFKLIQHTTIVHGVIQDECIYVRHGQKIDLVSAIDPDYIVAKTPTKPIKDCKPKDIVAIEGKEAVFVGRKFVVEIKPEFVKHKRLSTSWGSREEILDYEYIIDKDTKTNITVRTVLAWAWTIHPTLKYIFRDVEPFKGRDQHSGMPGCNIKGSATVQRWIKNDPTQPDYDVYLQYLTSKYPFFYFFDTKTEAEEFIRDKVADIIQNLPMKYIS